MAKRNGTSIAGLFRALLLQNPDITAKEAVEKIRKEHGRVAHLQTFYGVKSALKRDKAKQLTTVPQKRRKHRKHYEEPTPVVNPDIEIEMLRRENRKLKDLLMRSLMD